MIVTCVYVWVKPEYIDEFIEATIDNHNHSIREPGNLRFDVLQNEVESGRFMLYEVWDSEEAAAGHKKTAHYLKWRDTVAPWMEKPRVGVPHQVICPTEITSWR